MSKKCTVIDNKTGEIINENFNIDEINDIKRRKNITIKKQEYEDFKRLESEYLGEFVFYVFKHMDKLEELLNDNYIVKFLYCCSYVKKDGYLMLDNNKMYINKNILNNLLKVSRKTFNKFYNILIHSSLIKEIGNKIQINMNICWKGNMKGHENIINKKIKDFTRLYIKTIRELYETVPIKSHKRLAIVYKLIPYTNWQYNMLTSQSTIEELDKQEISPLTIGNIMDILHYDKSHLARFKKDFYSLKYKGYNIFATVQFDADFKKSFVIVNPLFFYRGNSLSTLEYLITLFKLNK